MLAYNDVDEATKSRRIREVILKINMIANVFSGLKAYLSATIRIHGTPPTTPRVGNGRTGIPTLMRTLPIMAAGADNHCITVAISRRRKQRLRRGAHHGGTTRTGHRHHPSVSRRQMRFGAAVPARTQARNVRSLAARSLRPFRLERVPMRSHRLSVVMPALVATVHVLLAAPQQARHGWPGKARP